MGKWLKWGVIVIVVLIALRWLRGFTSGFSDPFIGGVQGDSPSYVLPYYPGVLPRTRTYGGYRQFNVRNPR